MRYFILEPEIAGGWGERTVADTGIFPPTVTALHYRFDGWRGDELLESFPCFIVTDRFAVLAEHTAAIKLWDRVALGLVQPEAPGKPAR